MPSLFRKTMRYTLITITFAIAALLPLAAQTQQPATPSPQRALVDKYCVTCHNQKLKTAGVMFDKMDLAHPGADARIWEEAVRKLRGGLMPPPGLPKPDAAAVKSFIASLETSLDEGAAKNPNPGHVALHRLNRAEYANAIEDILDLRLDPSALLPVDDISDGFDNIANVLKVSPSFLDQYISAARLATATAIGSPHPAPLTVSLKAPAGMDQSMYVPGLPLGTRGGVLVDHIFPADGEYVFSIAGLAGAGYAQGMEYRHKVVMTIDGAKVFENEVGGEQDLKLIDQKQAPAVAAVRARFDKIRVPVKAGPHKVGVTFVARGMAESDNTLQSFVPGSGIDRIPRIGGVEVAGPYNPSGVGDTPSRQRIFVCRPPDTREELPCANRILSNIARKAFRRPVTDRDLAAPLAFFKQGREHGDFEAGIQNGMTAILASPKFLYRAEAVPADLKPGAIYRISDLELASRLSFFLWSQNPDDKLIDLAVDGKLSNPVVLEQQVRRMLADPRSKALVTNFAFQWLNMRGIADIDPDPVLFPGFDRNLRTAFLKELELFVQSIINENRSVVDLLTANYTFVNERLALHYGIPNVRGTQFRRVTLTDPNRYGLLGKGAVLMVTSYANRTAPVLRGAWILERIMGTPPSPPPPNVEAFPETKEGAKALSVRERMEQHRKNASCNSCHGIMDPLGFALENFDAVGEWRTMDRYAGIPIDSSGKLVDGTPVNGPADLRLALAKNSDQFVQTMTEKMMMYALGRRVEYNDMPGIRKIVREAGREQDRFSSLVMGIVKSAPFQMKQIDPAPVSLVAASTK
jgi:mono/diheme cytochrome c family protein